MSAAKPEGQHPNLAAALAAVHGDVQTVAKAGTSNYGKFATLGDTASVVLPALSRHGLAFSACPTLTPEGAFVLRYSLTHTSGEGVGGDYPLPDPTKSQAQALGSAITYARRYALQAVTSVAAEDDDGQEAQKAQPQEAPRRAQRGRPTREENATWEVPVPVVTDHLWLTSWRESVVGATEAQQVRDAWPLLQAKHQAREIEEAHYDEGKALLKERLTDLEPAPEPAEATA